MNIQGTHQLGPWVAYSNAQVAFEPHHAEQESTVIPTVDESAANASSQNQQFTHDSSLESDAKQSQDETSDDEKARRQQTQDELERKQLELQQAEIQKLKSRDLEVRQHEAAHGAVGGSLAGAPSYEYETGPDGKRYAVAGEVSISIVKVPGDPEQTLRNAEKIRAAALAPAEPSAQDLRVAAMATQMAIEASAEIRAMKQRELQESKKEADEKTEKTENDVSEATESEPVEIDKEPVKVSQKDPESKYDPFEKKDNESTLPYELTNSVEITKHFAEISLLGSQPDAGALLNLTT